MNFSTAEEIIQQKNKVRNERDRKLTKDRRNKNGNHNLAQTDGLKPIRTHNRRNYSIVIDDQEIDLRRVRNADDLLTDDDIKD